MSKVNGLQMMKFAALGAIVAAAVPELSFAQDFSTVSENFFQQMQAMPKLISAVAYIGGSILAFSGALKLKAHAENAAQNPMAPGIGRLLVGGALVSLPSLLSMARDTTTLTGAATFDPLQM